MTQPLFGDFETRSAVDLKEVGLWNYVRHPSTDVWCFSHAIGDGEPWVWTTEKTFPDGFLHHVRDGGMFVAHNAAFELAIWNGIMVPRYGWPPLTPEQTHCTMAGAYAMGLPGALEDAGQALGLSIHKDAEGRALMLRMARPRKINPDGTIVWWNEPDKLARLYAYCQQDVRVEREVYKRLMPLSDKERRVWLLDYKINQRGVAIDMPTAKAALAMANSLKDSYDVQLAKITGGAVETVNALIPLKQWLADHGCADAQDGLAKQDVVDILERPDLQPVSRAVLTLRQEAGKASTAKFDVMVAQAGDDGRLHNLYQYHGAGPGRWSGRAVQPHNLVRDMPKADIVEKVLAAVREGQHDKIDMLWGSPLTMVSRCMRSFFVAPDGKLLISGDWANVEGRGQAWFAGEDWKIKAFIAADNKTGPGIYELAYARMFGVPVEAVKDPSEERQVGKVSELAFGYGGGVGSGKTMGKTYGVKASDAQWDEWKDLWRDAHPMIAGQRAYNPKTGRWYRKGGVWKAIEEAAIAAACTPGETYACGHPGRVAKFKKVGSFLWLLLPSGRAICYPYPAVMEGQYGPMLTYMSVPGQDKSGIISDPKNSHNWARFSTWGGTLFNNIVQGFCRDFLAEGMLELDGKGAAIVLHTHDDINVEIEKAKDVERARAAMEQVMRTPPAWAAGFPLYAKCKVMARYGK